MSVLADYRTRISQILEDTGNSRYSTGLIDEALRWALAEYSKASPQVSVGTVTVSAEGREQSLAALTGAIDLLQLEFPYDSTIEKEVSYETFYAYHRNNVLYVNVRGAQSSQVGDVIRAYYTQGHTINGLASASATTVNDKHETVVCIGASGKAAMIRAGALVEAYGSKTGETNKLIEWAERQTAWYENKLERMRLSFSGMPGMESKVHWQLDFWDK